MNYILEYPMSALLYISIIFIMIIMSVIASKNEEKRFAFLLLVCIIIILSLFSGVRALSVGTDTAQYVSHIFRFQNGINYALRTEPGLRIISILASQIVEGYTFTLIVVSLIINTLIIGRLWSFRPKISFPFSVFIYCCTYYFMTFSGIRQWLAIAIVFYASEYLFEKKYIKFAILVLLASLFHNTAIVSLGLPILDILFNKKRLSVGRNNFLLFIIITPFILFTAFILEYKLNLVTQYSGYIKNIRWNSSTGLVISIRMFIGLSIGIVFKKRNFKDPEFYSRLYKIYLFGLIVSIPGYYIPNLYRVGLYFSVFEIILFGLVMKSKTKNNKLIFFIIVTVFTLLMFTNELAGSGRGQMPYIPYWLDGIY